MLRRDQRRVIHEGTGRPCGARLGQDRHVVQEEAVGVRRDRTQKAIERRNIVEPPRIGDAVADDAPARHQHSATCAEQRDLLAEHLDAFGRQRVDPMLDGADGFGVVEQSVAPDGGRLRRGVRRLARPLGRFVHFLSLVQTRSMSWVAASGQEGVKAILMSAGTFNSGASFMAGS